MVIRQIRNVMAAAGVSQAQLGARCGRGQSWAGRRLTGEVALSLADVDAIADALNVPPQQLTNP